jgi:cyclopropane fatty-acyl-phospholipid synthase-like methyltransferase
MLNYSEACERNKQSILEKLSTYLACRKTILEVGSGSGQHALFLSSHHQHLTWQPSDQERYLDALQINIEQYASQGVLSPIELNVNQAWPNVLYDGVYTANTLHIMSGKEVESFFKGVGSSIEKSGCLFVYGPFRYNNMYTSASNAQFDQWLKARDPASGIRGFEAINALAHEQGLSLVEDCLMPANNQLLIWQR